MAVVAEGGGWLWRLTKNAELLIFARKAKSLEMEYGCKLCIGPCTTRGETSWLTILQGFYYDAFYHDLTLNKENFNQIQSRASKAVGKNKHLRESR
ncbi:threonine--tRNA ligase, mitochondrial 1-like isoform X2 [Curcuma longa]|uniref:threonine--tRNA ligase, mitochondrial 1-like isoform X2 n=1 Tax=Curcuma longa TaxID=136217 RepID=UPI003D9DC8E5